MYKTKRKYKIPFEEVENEDEFINYKIRLHDTIKKGNRKEYQYFKKQTDVKKDKKLTESEYKKISTSFFKAAAELMTEYEGGVFLERYGYFSLLIIPYENRGLKIGKWFYDNLQHTDGYRYVPILDTDVTSRSCIPKMIMDRTYNIKLKKIFWKNITEYGFRPKNYYTYLKSLYSHGNAKT